MAEQFDESHDRVEELKENIAAANKAPSPDRTIELSVAKERQGARTKAEVKHAKESCCDGG